MEGKLRSWESGSRLRLDVDQGFIALVWKMTCEMILEKLKWLEINFLRYSEKGLKLKWLVKSNEMVSEIK